MSHQPENFDRRILLAVTGHSPQIVTETLYALAVSQDPAFIPTEIHVISTSEGLERASLMLLDPDQGQFQALLTDYELETAGIRFDESCLHVIRDEMGQPLADITDKEANNAAANLVLEKVREFCADDACAVHASIAGGRKTMGYYLGYAMSLLGRHQDRLSHVLVNAPFESSSDFFFPPARPRMITVRDMPVHTRDARIMLADIPFVRMRTRGALKQLQHGSGYTETVEQVQSTLEEPSLHIDLDAREIVAHGRKIRLSPINIGLLTWFAARVQLGRSRVCLTNEPQRILAQLLPVFRQAEVANLEPWEALLTQPPSLAVDEDIAKSFSTWLSRLHKELNKRLGPISERYRIVKTGERGRTRYALPLTSEQVSIKCEGFDETLQALRDALE